MPGPVETRIGVPVESFERSVATLLVEVVSVVESVTVAVIVVVVEAEAVEAIGVVSKQPR